MAVALQAAFKLLLKMYDLIVNSNNVFAISSSTDRTLLVDLWLSSCSCGNLASWASCTKRIMCVNVVQSFVLSVRSPCRSKFVL